MIPPILVKTSLLIEFLIWDGRLKVKSGKKWKSVGGTGSYMMEVKEGDSNYGVKAKNRKWFSKKIYSR